MTKKNETDAKAESLKRMTHRDVPATVGLVKKVRDELRTEIRAVRTELKSEISAVRTELKSEVGELRTEMRVGFDKLSAAVHRTEVLMEEQRSENRIVLDGLKLVLERQDRVELDVRDLRKTVEGLKRPS